MIGNYMTVAEAAEKREVTNRIIQKMCLEGRIEGAVKFGRSWAIPEYADRPKDRRLVSGKYRNWRNIHGKRRLKSR